LSTDEERQVAGEYLQHRTTTRANTKRKEATDKDLDYSLSPACRKGTEEFTLMLRRDEEAIANEEIPAHLFPRPAHIPSALKDKALRGEWSEQDVRDVLEPDRSRVVKDALRNLAGDKDSGGDVTAGPDEQEEKSKVGGESRDSYSDREAEWLRSDHDLGESESRMSSVIATSLLTGYESDSSEELASADHYKPAAPTTNEDCAAPIPEQTPIIETTGPQEFVSTYVAPFRWAPFPSFIGPSMPKG